MAKNYQRAFLVVLFCYKLQNKLAFINVQNSTTGQYLPHRGPSEGAFAQNYEPVLSFDCNCIKAEEHRVL